MKKAAMLAILGAVAAGAAAVCAKVIRDRQNEAEDEYNAPADAVRKETARSRTASRKQPSSRCRKNFIRKRNLLRHQ